MIGYFLTSILMACLILFIYRLGISDANKIKNNLPIQTFDILKSEEEKGIFDEEFLEILKNIDEYDGALEE